MNITIRQLKIFEVVAQHLSYTRAAELLFLSQPAVSMQIKQLESQIGLAIIEKVGKRLFLTEAGEELLVYARTIINQLTELDDVMDELKGSQRGRLKIAVASTASSFSLKLLGEFYKRFPGSNISLDVTNRASLLNHLEDNTVDMVIMGRPPEGMNVEATSFMENELVVVAEANHKLSNKTKIPLSVIQKETFIMREHGSGTRIAMEQFFRESGYDISSVMEMSSNDAINQAVEAGLGLSIVSRNTLRREIQLGQLTILDVESFPIMRHWYLVHRKGKRITAIMAEFKHIVEKESAEILNKSK